MARKSDVTYWKLMQAGLTRGTGATVGPRRNKGPAGGTNALDGEVQTGVSREEGRRPLPRSVSPGKLRLVFSNTCEPTRSKAGKPLPGVGSHLVLVWSDGHLVTAGRSKAMR